MENDRFISFEGYEVDLNNLDTYPDDWKKLTSYDLWLRAWSKAGKSLFYMDFLYPRLFDNQKPAVFKFCEKLVEMRLDVIKDSPENRLRVMKWLYRFEDETENQV